MSIKTGILTFQNANNYGAVLQAFALQTILEDMGHQASVINYDSPNMGLKQYHTDIFIKFISKYLNLTDEYRDGQDIDTNGFDMVITGSDQVWNPEITKGDETYFLKLRNCTCKLSSYAASIGISGGTLSQHADFFKDNLERIENISIRESTQKDFIESISGKKVNVNVDPTLLLDAEAYKKAFGLKNDISEHIFMYSNNVDPHLLDFVNLLSLKEGAPIFAVSNYDKPSFVGRENKVFYQVNPVDWLSAILSAKIVVTDSFHGLMFALIFEKPFYIYTKKRSNISRITDVLEACGLSDRTLKNLPSIDDVDYAPDFSRARVMISREREKSLEYLKQLI